MSHRTMWESRERVMEREREQRDIPTPRERAQTTIRLIALNSHPAPKASSLTNALPFRTTSKPKTTGVKYFITQKNQIVILCYKPLGTV